MRSRLLRVYASTEKKVAPCHEHVMGRSPTRSRLGIVFRASHLGSVCVCGRERHTLLDHTRRPGCSLSLSHAHTPGSHSPPPQQPLQTAAPPSAPPPRLAISRRCFLPGSGCRVRCPFSYKSAPPPGLPPSPPAAPRCPCLPKGEREPSTPSRQASSTNFRPPPKLSAM